MSAPYTIRIFVPNGNPDGVRIIDKMNWTGLGVTFPRSDWENVRNRDEFQGAGVYILVGYSDQEDDDLPTLYIGQADIIRKRIEQHATNKDFWDWAVVFVSNSDGLNRAHTLWLEYALYNQAKEAKRCHLDNGNVPSEPRLTEAEKADIQGFFKEILQILPLVNLKAFEVPKAISAPVNHVGHDTKKQNNDEPDTIIIPAKKGGFERVFIGQNCWHAIRISGGKIDKIRYIAAYQTNPISAVTHYAPVSHIEPYGEEGKYKVVFSEPAKEISPIPFADATTGAMQGPRYTTFEKLIRAKKLNDLL